MKRSLSSSSDSSCHCHLSKISCNNNIIMPLKNYKIFNDSVHGHMKVHPLCVAIIDTPQFQRLRNLKQLSTTYFVYPGASHNRFEHSLGVCYLAGCMIDALVLNTPYLKIEPEEKLSVEVAGLCHDLGHGPFSHTWERYLESFGLNWKHDEGSSEQVLEYLIEDNNLQPMFDKYKLDIDLIKELIRGKGTKLPNEKRFLYQIINNKISSIDVDKWDYFLRDGHQLNLKITFDYRRLISFCMVVPPPKPNHALQNGNSESTMIAFRNKEEANIFDMFRVRADLHYRAYQHTAVKNTELILLDGLAAADEYYKVEADGKSYKLSEAHLNVKAFCKLSDHILYSIMYSDDPNFLKAQSILNRLNKRELYTVLGEFRFSKGREEVMKTQGALEEQFPTVEFTHALRKIDMGCLGNPLEKVVFYKKPTDSDNIEIDDKVGKDEFRNFYFDMSKELGQKELIVFAKSKVEEDIKEKIEEFTKKYLEDNQYQ